MPIFIEGHVEYLSFSDDIKENSIWETWMQVESIIQFNDDVNHKIFGNPRDFKNNQEDCIAKGRGFPTNPSQKLKDEIIWIKKQPEGLFGFTHFLYSEVNNYDWESILSGSNSNWLNLFELTEHFMKIKKLSAEKIRFVTWYNW